MSKRKLDITFYGDVAIVVAVAITTASERF